MTRLFTHINLLCCLFFISTNIQAQYCPSGSNSSNGYISHVQFDSINNSSFFIAGGYSDYSNISDSMYASETEEVVITNGNSSFPASCGVWVDWNQNGDFTDEDAIVITGGPEVFIAFIGDQRGSIV